MLINSFPDMRRRGGTGRRGQWQAHVQCALRTLICASALVWLRLQHGIPNTLAVPAGVACRDAGRLGAALALLNRFLDVSEAMGGEDDGEPMPNAAFAGSHVPAHFDLPQQHFLAGSALQEVRRLLLQPCMFVGKGAPL